VRAFWTVLVDSVRLLRARVLFWLSLGLSVLAAFLYLSIGFNESGVELLFGVWDIEMPFMAAGTEGAELLYLGIFRTAIVGWWLSWIAIILALISCAPIFPEFMEEGSAGVTLSKPVSRGSLFLYKFVGGLMFMAVQVVLFTAIVFVAIRMRLGDWNFSVWWSVPLVLLVFSYLWAVLVVIGIRTRSVIASVLLTLLFWLGCFLFQFAEAVAYNAAERGIGLMGESLDAEQQEKWRGGHRIARVPYAILPKTGETIGLLDRWIVLGDGGKLGASTVDAMSGGGMLEADAEALEDDLERHSPWFVIGSSLVFEAVVLGWGMWRFSRRDF